MTSLQWHFPGSLDTQSTTSTLTSFSTLGSLMQERAQAVEHSDNVDSLYVQLSSAKNGAGNYQPGDLMRGEVWIRVNHDTHVSKLVVKVRGKCHISIKPGDSSKPLEANEDYLKDTVTLVDENTGMTLQEGMVRLPFDYRLPDNVPSSFVGQHGSIQYSMRAQLYEDKRNSPITCNKSFSVSRPLAAAYTQTNKNKNSKEGRRGNGPVKKSGSAVVLHQACFPGRMYAQVKVNKRHHAPGTELICNARTWNNSNRLITSMQAAIRMTSVYSTRKGRSSTFTQIVSRKSDNWELEKGEGREWKDVTLSLPAHLPDSQLAGCELISVSYQFVFSITTKRRTKRPLEIVIPITVGANPAPLTDGEVLAQELDAVSAYGSLHYADSSISGSTSTLARSNSLRRSSDRGSVIQLSSIQEGGEFIDPSESISQIGSVDTEHEAIKSYIQNRQDDTIQKENIGQHLRSLQNKMVLQAVDKYKEKKMPVRPPRKKRQGSQSTSGRLHTDQPTIPLGEVDPTRHAVFGERSFRDPYLDAKVTERAQLLAEELEEKEEPVIDTPEPVIGVVQVQGDVYQPMSESSGERTPEIPSDELPPLVRPDSVYDVPPAPRQITPLTPLEKDALSEGREPEEDGENELGVDTVAEYQGQNANDETLLITQSHDTHEYSNPGYKTEEPAISEYSRPDVDEWVERGRQRLEEAQRARMRPDVRKYRYTYEDTNELFGNKLWKRQLSQVGDSEQ